MSKFSILLLICPLVVFGFGEFAPTRASSSKYSTLNFIDRELKLKTYDYLNGSEKTSIPRSEYGLSFWERFSPLFSDSENSIVRSRAENGDAQSQYELGLRFKYGHRDILKNEETAIRWFKRAAKTGNPDAILELGNPKDISILHRKGNANASFWLASYRKEHGYVNEPTFFGNYNISFSERKKDIDFSTFKAKNSWLKFLQIASQRGHTRAKYKLGIYYLNRNELSSDHKKAHDLFQSVASESTEAAIALGTMKGLGWGCDRDFEQGFLYLLHDSGIPLPEKFSSEIRLADLFGLTLEQSKEYALEQQAELWVLLLLDVVKRFEEDSNGIAQSAIERVLHDSALKKENPIGLLWFANFHLPKPDNSGMVWYSVNFPDLATERCLKSAQASGITVTNELQRLAKARTHYEKKQRQQEEKRREKALWIYILIAIVIACLIGIVWIIKLIARVFKGMQAQRKKEEGTEPLSKRVFLPKLLLAGLLLIGILDAPYNYYVLLRWIVCPAFLYFAYRCYKEQFMSLAWVFGIMGGIYNPLFLSPFSMELWVVLNGACVMTLFYSAFRKSKGRLVPALIGAFILVATFFLFEHGSYFDWDDLLEPPRSSRRR